MRQEFIYHTLAYLYNFEAILLWYYDFFLKSYINCHIANLTSCSKNKTYDKKLIKTDHAITRLSTGPMKRDR